MKDCLQCGEKYENKRETSKFCSDKCRVKYNRKNPKQGVTKLQMQVLYNSVLALVQNHTNELPPDYQNIKAAGILKANEDVEPLSFDKLREQIKSQRPPKTMAKYFEDKRDCTCQEDYDSWLAEVEADPYLKPKEKQILKQSNPSQL